MSNKRLDVMVSLSGSGSDSYIISVHEDDYDLFARTLIEMAECDLNVVVSRDSGTKKEVLGVNDMKMAFGYLMLKGRKKNVRQPVS